MSNVKIRETITTKITELQLEAKKISDQIVALELAAETFAEAPAPAIIAEGKLAKLLASPKLKLISRPKAKIKTPIRRVRGLDLNATAKTVAFMQGRSHATTVESVARRFGLSRAAANQRLLVLLRAGTAARIGRGRYKLTSALRQVSLPIADVATNGVQVTV